MSWDPSRNPMEGRKTSVRIGYRRRDGKYPVDWGFYGRPIRKIRTLEQLREDLASLDPNLYQVFGRPAELDS